MCFWIHELQAQQVRLEDRFTIDLKAINLDNALKVIENETDVQFSYVSKDVRAIQINMSFTNAPLYFILQKLLSPHNFSFIYIGQNSYVIHKENIDFEFSYQATGFVRDKTTRRPLRNVLVSSPSENITVITNDSGFFSLRLRHSPQDLVFTYQGFHSEVRVADADDYFYHSLYLERNTLSEIVKKESDTLSLNLRSSGFSINFGTMDEMPSVHTSQGILNSVKFISGLQSSVDANGGITVRGGNIDENLVLYDGVLVYNPMHLPGWFSVFSKRSVDKANLIKSGFSSNYGGRTSSVIDTRSKPGNFKKIQFGLSVSPISSEGFIEGPLKKDILSFFVSARRTFTDLWSPLMDDLFNENGIEKINIYLYDLNSGIDWKTGLNSKIKARFYFGGDRGYLNEKLRITGNTIKIREDNRQSYYWGNMLGSVEWIKLINNRLNVRVLSYFTRYAFKLDNSYNLQLESPSSLYQKVSNLTYGNDVQDAGSQVQFNWRLSSRHKIQFGGDAILHAFKPPTTEYTNSINGEVLDSYNAGDNSISASELNSFVSYSYSAKKVSLNGGLRYSLFKVDNPLVALQPRIQANIYPKPDIRIYADYDRMNQFIFSINSNEAGLQYAVWVPVSEGLKPIQADQYSLGVAKRFKGKTQLIAEGYYKEYSRVYDYQNSSIDFLKNWQDQISDGKGYAKGVELTFKSGGNGWNGWVAYTLSKTERQFDEINEGNYFPFQFNRPHDLSLFFNMELQNGWILGGSWIYASGNFITIPESRYIIEFEGEILVVETLGARNNYKLPAYHRLDVGLSKTYIRKNYNHRISFSVYNAYFSQNPYYVTLSFNENGTPVLNQVSLLPLMPILQYAIEFR